MRDARTILGAANHARSWIPRFDDTIEPLRRLAMNGVPFTWSPEAFRALDTLIGNIRRCAALKAPDYSKPLLLYSDASDVAAGGALVQMHESK